jgi:NADPH:quinone reductase
MAKAFRFYEHGGPEVLRLEDVAIGEPQRGELRIRNTAVAVNFRDVLVRRGTHAVKAFPSGIGLESAGVVEAVGLGVDEFSVGQRVVCAAGPDTAYAEARIIPAARAIVLPPAIDERTAAAMMIRGMTARYLLKETYRVKPGDTMLIHAAAGGVGQIVCQWAKHLGATVIGTVGSREKAEIARKHGCDHTILYRESDFVAAVKAIAPQGVTAVYDGVGKDVFLASLDCVRPFGVLVNYGNASGHPPPLDLLLLAKKGSLSVSRPALSRLTADVAAMRAAAAELFDLVQRGALTIEIGGSFPLSDAAAAHRAVEERSVAGSVLLIP